MSFRGDVRSMALDEVFAYLAQNGLTGTLAIKSGEDVALRLFFAEGRLFFPEQARRGTYQLGRILRHTGVLSRDGLRRYLSDLHERQDELKEQEDSPGVAEARRLQFTEEVHDTFLWNDARFEFQPGPWPARIQADRDHRRGYEADVTSLLMDVARREDERRRIRASLPSARLILRTVPGSGESVLSGLKAAKVEVGRDPFDGTSSLEDLLAAWGIPHHEALVTVATFVERGLVVPIPRDEAALMARAALSAEDVPRAATALGHWNEVRAADSDRFEVDLERELTQSEVFRRGPECAVKLRLSGARAFALLSSLLAEESTFRLVLHGRGIEKQVCGLPGEVLVYDAPRRDEPHPPLVEYLAEAGALKKKAAKAWRALAPEARPDLKAVVGPAPFLNASRACLVDAVAEVALWRKAEVELVNRALPSKDLEPGGEELLVPLDGPSRLELSKGLARWARTFALLPSEDCLLVQADGGDANDPAARFFQRFSLEASVAELRRDAQTSALEFARFIHQGIKRGYLRPPRVEELRRALKEARAGGREVSSHRLALSGVAYGYAGFQSELERLGAAGLPAAEAGLEGDLDGVGLAAVLQSLRNNRRTGTLTVRSGRREERLCFQSGDAFFLEVDDSEGDAFVEFFLGEDGADSLGDLGGGGGGRGLVAEDDLDRDELAELKKRFLDILLWDDSTFAFYQSSLPEEFFSLGDAVTKVALRTERFLLQAMQVMSAWEEAAEVFQRGSALLEFADAEAKHRSIRECGLPEMLTLIDGRLSFDDLVRASGAPRLEAGQLVSELVRLGVMSARLPDPPDPASLGLSELPEPIRD